MKSRIEELAKGLFNPLGRDRYLDDSELRIINEHITTAVNEALELAAMECDYYAKQSSNPMNFSENCAEAIRNLKV